MSTKTTPAWITVGGLLFSLTAGFINAVGFLGIHHHGLSHVTGQVTLVSISLAKENPSEALKAVTVGLWFFAGAIVSGTIIQRPELSRRGRRYGVVMVLEGAVLALATWLLVSGDDRGEALAAMACGLQNAMATSYSGSVLRTTHVTGIVTDLGILLGHWVRREPVETQRLRLLASLLFGFVGGGFAGTFAFARLGAWSLSLPASWMLSGGLLFFVTRRALLPRHAPPQAQSAGTRPAELST